MLGAIFAFVWQKFRLKKVDFQPPPVFSERANGACFRAIVLTMDRSHMLQQLLSSLEDALYGNERIDLHIHVDYSPDALARVKTVKVANEFDFTHGTKTVSLATESRGLARAWFDAWSPNDESERAIILEDDIILSRYWFLWLTKAWIAYANHTGVAGISLQRQTLIPKEPYRNAAIVNGHEPFLYSLVGSIGFSPHPRVWREFLSWVEHLSPSLDVLTPGLVTSNWWNRLDKKHMWTQYFIFYCVQRNVQTLYVNLPNQKTLAAHQRSAGAHYSRTRGKDFETLQSVPNLEFPRYPVQYGWSGEVLQHVSPGFDAIVESSLLSLAGKMQSAHGFVYLLFTNKGFVEMTKSWLCNMKKLNVSIGTNFIIVGDGEDTVRELSTFKPEGHYFIYRSLHKDDANFGTYNYYHIVLERMLIENRIIQADVNIMIIEPDQIWTRDVSPLIRSTFTSGYDIIAGNEYASVGKSNVSLICGGFYGVASSTSVKELFKHYVDRHAEVLEKYKGTTGVIKIQNDQALLTSLVSKAKLRVRRLSACEYASGRWFTTEALQKLCPEPYVTHNNFIIGLDNKIQRLQRRGDWLLSSNGSMCVV